MIFSVSNQQFTPSSASLLTDRRPTCLLRLLMHQLSPIGRAKILFNLRALTPYAYPPLPLSPPSRSVLVTSSHRFPLFFCSLVNCNCCGSILLAVTHQGHIQCASHNQRRACPAQRRKCVTPDHLVIKQCK